MAFSERIRSDGTMQCSICRQILKDDGRRLRSKDYMGDAPICKSCLNRFFKDTKTGLSIGITDDPVSPGVRFRPAEPIEHDPIFRKKEPPCGYEHPFPELLISQIIRDCAFWLLLCGFLHMLLFLQPETHSISDAALHVLILGGSGLQAVRYTAALVRGIFYGIGHTRRIALVAAAAVMVLAAIFLS